MAQPKGGNKTKFGVREKLIFIWVLGLSTFLGVLTQITYPTPYEYRQIKELALGTRVPNVPHHLYTTPLHIACTKDNIAQIQEHLQKYDVNVLDEFLNTPLISACHLGGNDKVVSLLLNHGANPNFKNLADRTALHYAIQFHLIDIVEVLLNHNQTDVSEMAYDQSPVYMASCLEDERILSLLISKGSNIHYHDSIFDTPLHRAAFNGFLPNVQLLVENGAKINSRNMYWETPLFFAVERNSLEVAEYLIENGAKSIANIFGDTALHIAVKENFDSLVRYLVKDKTIINLLDSNNFTPLYWAVIKDDKEMVKLLCVAGADYRIGVNPFTDEKQIPEECKQKL